MVRRNVPSRKAAIVGSVVVCLTALLTVFFSTETAGARTASTKLTNVNIRLDWFAGGYHAGFYAAQAKGFYKAAGLNVSIEEGQGSSSTITLVGSGKDTFGFVSPVAMIQAVAAGAPVKMVAAVYQSDGSGILVRADSGITSPTQLAGKSCGISPYGYIHELMPAFFAKLGGDWSKVNAISADPTALIPELANKKLDGLCDAVAIGEPIQLKSKGIQGRFFPLSSENVSPLGWGIAVNNSTISSNPALVKAFVAATIKGFDWAFANPTAAVAMLDKAVKTQYPAAVDVQSLNVAHTLIHTAASKGKPFGWMATADWTRTLNLMTKYLGLKKAPALTDLYTNTFVPSG